MKTKMKTWMERKIVLIPKHQKHVDPELVDNLESDLKRMHLSCLEVSTNLVTGEIRIESMEIKDRFGRNSFDLTQDKYGDIRIYPKSTSSVAKPMTVHTWVATHEDMTKNDDEDCLYDKE